MPYTINGAGASFESEPQLKEGTMWVPLRDVAEALGASVDYEPSNGVALVTQGESLITIKMGDPAIDVNGTPHTLQATPFVEGGQAWVPVRFFNDAMGAQIGVDLSSNSVDISSPNVV